MDDNMQKKSKDTDEKEKNRRDKLASYSFDISKLTFGGIFVGIIIPMLTKDNSPKMWVAAFFGIELTLLSALLANKILK